MHRESKTCASVQLVLNVLEKRYAQSSDPEVRRCVEKVIGELHKAPAPPVPAPVAAATAPSDSGLDDPMESPMSPVAEPAPMAEIHAVRHVTCAEYQTRLLEFKVYTNVILVHQNMLIIRLRPIIYRSRQTLRGGGRPERGSRWRRPTPPTTRPARCATSTGGG